MKNKTPWLNRFLVALVIFWTIVIAASFLVNRQNTLYAARMSTETQARTAFGKDILYRRWNAAFNIYGQTSVFLQPNRYLPVEGRDLSIDGQPLTRINPAYMTRMVHEMSQDDSGMTSRIISSAPLNPENTPDEWEQTALERIAADQELYEISEITGADGNEYLRYVGPLRIEPGCLSCHAESKVGELRGGISVSVPMPQLNIATSGALQRQAVSHAAIWLLGLCVFGSGSWSITRRTRERDQAATELRNLSAELEIRIAEHSEDVQNKQQQLQAFMDNTDAAVYIKNNLHEFLMINKHLAEMIGKAPDELVGKRDFGFLGPAVAHRMESSEELVLSSGKSVEIELFDAHDSEYPPHSAHFFPIINAGSSRLTGVGCMLVDISKRKKTEEALLEAKESAEKTNQTKNDFLANMSHEIRTPLNGVLGMAELILRSGLNEDQAAMASTIKNGASSLLVVLNDILDFSKIEAGKMRLEHIPFSLRDTVFDAVKSMAAAAQDKGLEMSVNMDSSVPDNLKGDPQRLRQILLNLVSNAIKFTNRGEISVTAKLLEKNGQHAKLRLSVSDTGIGIPKDKQERIFASFEQADMSTTREFGGTGLGLSISSKLAGLMNSRLRVESRPGYGSTFWMDVTLPLAGGSPLRKPFFNPTALGRLNVLLMDSSPEDLQNSRAQLEAYNINSTCCSSLDEALRLLRQVDLGERKYNLVIAASNTDGEDIKELGRRLSTEQCGDKIPVILLCSGPVRDLDNVALFSSVLDKPVQAEGLAQAVSAAAGLWETVDMGQLNAKPAPLPIIKKAMKLRVLLVEDLHMNQLVASRMLGELGHEVVLAENGRIAMEFLDKKHFDLVLMDIQMPVLDGETTMRLIRSKEKENGGRHIPIIAITANAMRQDRDRYMEAGADAYLAKPMQLFKLAKAIDELAAKGLIAAQDNNGAHTEQKQPAKGSGAAMPAVPALQDSSGAIAPEAEQPCVQAEPDSQQAAQPPAGQTAWSFLEQETLESSFAGNADLMHQSMCVYITDAPRLLDEIGHALHAGNNRLLASKAHALKGLNSYFTRGLPYENALTLELSGRRELLPEGMQQLRRVFAALQEQISEICEEMRQHTGLLER